MEAGRPGQKANPPGRSFLSDIEKGKRSISPPTVGKLIHALEMPESWLDRFLATAPDDADEVTAKDEDADRLLLMAERDDALPPSAEGLLIGLAQSYAGGNYRDHFTAYKALKSALEVAQALKEQGSLPSNTSSQLDAVLREVAQLNDQGDFQGAAHLLDEEFSRASSALETVVQRQLDQDRFLNRPKVAADRLIAQLKRSAPPGGVSWATHELLWEWRDRAVTQRESFGLSVARYLAKSNLERAKRPHERALALYDLAICQSDIGERRADDRLLIAAESNLRQALKLSPRTEDPMFWASAMTSLGIVLSDLGDRSRDPGLLAAAITAHKEALQVKTRALDPLGWAMIQSNLGTALQDLGEVEGNPIHLIAAIEVLSQALLERPRDLVPMDWATTQNNLGLAHRWLGALTHNLSEMEAARVAFRLCLEEWKMDNVPFDWASAQWNFADLALACFDLTADRALLETARHHALAAREVFVLGSDHQTAECDRLLARIDSA